MVVDLSNPTIGRNGAGVTKGNIYPFPLCKERASVLPVQEEAMTSEWKPDIVDYRIFDKEKADFVYASSAAYLEATIKISDSYDDKAFKILGLLITLLSAILSYMLLKCDFSSFACQTGGANAFWPAMALLSGFSASAFMLAAGCFRFQQYALSGNQPRNLIRNDLCSMEAPLVKISSAISLDDRISNNLANLKRTSKRLKLCVMIALATVVIASALAMVSASTAPLPRQTSPSLPSPGYPSVR
jgi:hypothetical protein